MKGKKKNGAKRQAPDGNGQGAGFQKGAELELFIEDMGTEGEGIGKYPGWWRSLSLPPIGYALLVHSTVNAAAARFRRWITANS